MTTAGIASSSSPILPLQSPLVAPRPPVPVVSNLSAPYRQFGLIESLVKDLNPPSPEVLKLGNFEDYRIVEYLEDLKSHFRNESSIRKAQQLIDAAKENIRKIQEDIQRNGVKYYFLKAADGPKGNSNPYIAKLKSNG